MTTDGLGAYAGTGSAERLAESFLHEGQFAFVALGGGGEIRYASEAVRLLLGYDPAALLQMNAVDLLRPDDVERALTQLVTAEGGSVMTGVTRFHLRHAAGDFRPLELFAHPVTDGAEDLIGVYLRDGMHQVVLEEILSLLLAGAPRQVALAPVCNVIAWHEVGSHLAICWEDERGLQQVSTGLPDALCGGDGRPGTPFSLCRSSEPLAGRRGSSDDLDPELAEIARSESLGLYWCEPVVWSDRYPPAVLTIWTRGGQIVPELHSYGMQLATRISELILRWTEHVAALSYAASVDPLTGLKNRRSFFAELGAAQAGGALCYLDLDRFKPVNDTHGHVAGDTVLRLVARRVRSCVREHDLVARLGGDEFAVLLPGASLPEAVEIAGRIRQALREPFTLGELTVQLGVSIGVAATTDRADEDLLAAADRALVVAKASGRDRVQVAAPASVDGPVR